jgi:PAS domain S-box-containing protein
VILEEASELDYRELFERNPVPVFIVDAASLRLLDANDAAVERYGYSREELLSLTARDLRPPEDVPRFLASSSFERFQAEQRRGPNVVPSSWRHRTKDGTVFDVEIRRMPIRYHGVNASLAFVQDVTAWRRLEGRLRDQQEVEATRLLMASFAHEISNPLTFVMHNLALVARETAAGARDPGAARPSVVEEAVREAIEGADRIGAIVRDMRAVPTAKDDALRPIDVRPVLQSCVRTIQHDARRRARIALSLEELPRVEASEARLGQVFLNLLINAVQSMDAERATENELRVATYEGAEGVAIVEIRDTGSGIAPENRSKIFEPFFTTKPAGVGSGLGLAVCRTIVRDLGGDIQVDGAEGRGSTFRVVLPGCAGRVD